MLKGRRKTERRRWCEEERKVERAGGSQTELSRVCNLYDSINCRPWRSLQIDAILIYTREPPHAGNRRIEGSAAINKSHHIAGLEGKP